MLAFVQRCGWYACLLLLLLRGVVAAACAIWAAGRPGIWYLVFWYLGGLGNGAARKPDCSLGHQTRRSNKHVVSLWWMVCGAKKHVHWCSAVVKNPGDGACCFQVCFPSIIKTANRLLPGVPCTLPLCLCAQCAAWTGGTAAFVHGPFAPPFCNRLDSHLHFPFLHRDNELACICESSLCRRIATF